VFNPSTTPSSARTRTSHSGIFLERRGLLSAC
jgi:hypothetical protein